MIDQGSIIISHETGWACAKECVYDMELDKRPDGTMKGTVVFFPKGLYSCIGEVKDFMPIKGMFIGDKGAKISFNGILQKKGRIVTQGEVNNNFNTIIKEIKSWQENYRVS